jgi:O-methyltransferase
VLRAATVKEYQVKTIRMATRAWLRRHVRNLLSRSGLQIQRIAAGAPAALPLWDADPIFGRLFDQLIGYTLVDKVRCFMLYQCAKNSARIAGDIAEIGVFRGGTAKLLAKTSAPDGKTIHLFDTFAGMPSVDASADVHRAGDFANTSLAAVQAYLRDCSNVRLYQGIFPATAAPVEQRSFALVHIDVDIYQSVLSCCIFFYPRMEHGGMMIFDDYGFWSCPGAKKAVDEFFMDKPEVPIYLPTGQCLVIRA